MEDVITNAVENGSSTEAREECPKYFHLFNCDKTYNLDAVEKLLFDTKDDIRRKLNFDIQLPIRKNYFPLSKMSEMCETTIPKLKMDFAVFVVHAHESRLSINEDNAGIGYARIYKALLRATDENVLIVIGGDDNYRKDEEESSVISRWTRRKVSSQFQEEFLDGRKSFIFSWDKKHRAIHEEALLHYFDPRKEGQKFVYQPNDHFKVSPTGHEIEAENKNVQGQRECDDKYQEQKLEDEADGLAENSTNIKIYRETPGIQITLEQGAESKRKDDPEIPEEETQPHSLLSDWDYCLDKEECEVDAPDTNNTEVEPETDKSEVETLLMKTRLRYGKVSSRNDDKVVGNEQWTLPEELLSDISDRFKNVAKADLEIYRVEETGAIRVKITRNSLIYAIIEIVCDIITWIKDNVWLYIDWARGSEAVKEEGEAIDYIAKQEDEYVVIDIQK